MSFVDLMGNDKWSEADIVRRTEAMVRAEVSADAETILNRKLQGASIGQYVLTPEDQAEINRFNSVVFGAQTAGAEARADMAKLQAVFDYEAAQARLALPVYDGPATITDGEGNTVPNPAIALDAEERTAAQAVIDAASVDTLALAALRAPAPEPEPEPEVLP